MMTGFIIWSIASLIFLGIGIRSCRAREAVGFFTFIKPPKVKGEDVKRYNNAVSVLWIVSAGALELIGIPLLFSKQNSPVFILMSFAVVILILIMMVVYLKIEKKYKK